MIVLAFDTSLGAVSVALRWPSGHGNWAIREAYEEREGGHAERLMPMIGEVLEGSGVTIAAVDRIAVTVGPGTFTGVRTGIAAARAFHLAAGMEIVGMTSLALIAWRAALLLGERRAGLPLAVAVDARRGQIYLQLFGANAGEPLSEPEALEPEAALDRVAGRRMLAVGSGARQLAQAALARQTAIDVALERLEPHARGLAHLGAVLPKLDPVTPLYLRAPDAKPQAGKSLPRMA